MATAATPTVIESSHASEVLEVASSILQRHRDEDLAKKTFVMRGYLEMSKMHPERDYCDALNKALADLTGAVHLHLNAELHAINSIIVETCHDSNGTDQEIKDANCRQS